MFARIWKDLKKYGIAILFVVVFYFFMHILFDAFCPSVVITGLPCPGCGLTRSVLFFITGQWERSFYVHPLGFVVVLFVIYCVYFRYVRGKRIPGIKWMIALFFLALVFLFVVRMQMYFPDRPPYTYNRGNLIEKILPDYRAIWY